MASTTITTQPNDISAAPATCLVDDAEVCRLVESYLSKESLQTQPFLISRMNTDLWISLDVLAEFKPLHDLKISAGTIKRAIKSSETVSLSEDQTAVRPKIKLERKTLILRDIPSSTEQKEIENIFEFLPESDRPNEFRTEVGNNWYVTFSSEDKCLKAHLALGDKKFGETPIRSRVKPETLFKTSFQPAGYQTPRFLQHQQIYVPVFGGQATEKVVAAGPVHFTPYRGPFGVTSADQQALPSHPASHPFVFSDTRARGTSGRGRGGARPNNRKPGMRRNPRSGEESTSSASSAPAPLQSSTASPASQSTANAAVTANSTLSSSSASNSQSASATQSASSHPSHSQSRPHHKKHETHSLSAPSANKGKPVQSSASADSRLTSNQFPPLPAADTKPGEQGGEPNTTTSSGSPKGESDKTIAAPSSSRPQQPQQHQKHDKSHGEAHSHHHQQRPQKSEQQQQQQDSNRSEPKQAPAQQKAAAYAHVLKQPASQPRAQPSQPQSQQQQEKKPTESKPSSDQPSAGKETAGTVAATTVSASGAAHKVPGQRRPRGEGNQNTDSGNNNASGKANNSKGRSQQSGSDTNNKGTSKSNTSASNSKDGKGKGREGRSNREGNREGNRKHPNQEHPEQSSSQHTNNDLSVDSNKSESAAAAQKQKQLKQHTQQQQQQPQQQQQQQQQQQSENSANPAGSSFRDALMRKKAASAATPASTTSTTNETPSSS